MVGNKLRLRFLRMSWKEHQENEWVLKSLGEKTFNSDTKSEAPLPSTYFSLLIIFFESLKSFLFIEYTGYFWHINDISNRKTWINKLYHSDCWHNFNPSILQNNTNLEIPVAGRLTFNYEINVHRMKFTLLQEMHCRGTCDLYAL